MGVLRTDGCRRVGNAVAAPAAVVEYHQVSFARKALGDHVEMMLADDPAQLLKLRGGVEVRSDAPYDLAGLLVQDCQDVGFAAVKDNVLRFKAHVALVVPLVRP